MQTIKLLKSLSLATLLLLGTLTMSISQSTELTKETEKPPVVTKWIYILGCPRGEIEMFIFVTTPDGTEHIVHMTKKNWPGDDIVSKILGTAPGYTHKFDCGVSS